MMISCIDNNDNDFFDETENQLCSSLSILHLVCAFDETYLLKHFLLFYGRAAVSRYEFQSVLHMDIFIEPISLTIDGSLCWIPKESVQGVYSYQFTTNRNKLQYKHTERKQTQRQKKSTGTRPVSSSF